MTKEEARERVAEVVARDSEPGMLLGIDDSQTAETSFGWVFFYNTVAYIRGREPLDSLAGNAPILVDARSGELHQTGTADSIEHYIAQYEAQWGS